MFQLQRIIRLATLAGFAATLSIGCGQGSDIPLQEAPAVQAPPPQPVPKELRKGGGATSSGRMQTNPGGSN
jgi:hypothetical protein